MAQRKMELPNSDSLPGNSYASRDVQHNEEPKQIEQVVSNARVRKQGIFRRIGASIVEDSMENAKQRAFGEIVIPGIKTLIFDTLTEVLGIILFSDSRDNGYRPRSGIPSRRSDRTSYRDYYDRKEGRDNKRSREIPFDPDDIIVDTRAEAHMVLDEMDAIIDRYGKASVADFYDVVGVTSDWTDNRYGWTSLRSASIKPVRDGFMLVMPRTQVLED